MVRRLPYTQKIRGSNPRGPIAFIKERGTMDWKPKLRSHWIAEVLAQKPHEVKVCGWAQEVRALGQHTFIIIRDETGKIQAKLDEKIKVKRESVVCVEGEVKEDPRAPAGVEIHVRKLEILQEPKLMPFSPYRAGTQPLTTRLDYRALDLRSDRAKAIMRVRSSILNAFRRYFLSLGFTELTPPTLVGAATEGGAQVFRVEYFDRWAFLAQSPQFYKQLAVIGGLERVFMTCPVFRAEKHETPHHLNEIYQMDIEVGFSTDEDAIELLKGVIKAICTTLKEEGALESLGLDGPKPEIKEITYDEAIELLNQTGAEIEWGQDFSRQDQQKLCEVLECEFVLVKRFPTRIRAFYSFPCPENPKLCRSFDLIHNGIEVSSGAQRIHDPDMLERVLKERELDLRQFESYLQAFKLGAPPHAGWSIGLDRITMSICQLANIREAVPFPRDRKRLHP